MKRRLIGMVCAVGISVIPVFAQQQAAAPPKISEAQRQALMAVQNAAQANNWAGLEQAATQLVENFPDSPYKERVMYMALQASLNQKSLDQAVVWADRIIQADPNDILARVEISNGIAEHARENDLDLDKTTAKVDDYAHKALTALQSANTVPANSPIDPAQWPTVKQQLTGEAYYALALSAELKKNYPESQKDFQAASQAEPTNALYYARLAKVDIEAKQYDDAVAAAQKAIDTPNAQAPVKALAEQEKTQAAKMKAAAAAPAAK